MNLSPFQDTPFDDPEAFDDFKLSLQLNHDKIAQKIFATGSVYRTYPLIDSDQHTKDWQQNLQQELQAIYARLELTGLPDFSGTDLAREDDWETFFQQIIFVEARINFVLGIY